MKTFLSSLIFLSLLSVNAFASCNVDLAIVSKKLHSILKPEVKIQGIYNSPIRGLCEVVVESPNGIKILYTDEDIDKLLFGTMIDIREKTNLTQRAVEEHSKLNARDMNKLKSLVALTEGNGEREIYLVTDPKCPYCKQLEETLEDMVKNNEIKINVLFMPLPFHKDADKIAISTICDKKPLSAAFQGYLSKNQCEKAKKLLNETQEFMLEKGIQAVPTIIFKDGRHKSGVLSREEILRYSK